jgi:hypothetical protein
MKFTKNHTQLTDKDLDPNEEPKRYFVNGQRYEIINGQSVKISVLKGESNWDRHFRHMKPIEKARLNCEHTTKLKTGIVDFDTAKQLELL